MKLVVLITLAAVAMGRPPPCEDYCRTMWFTTQLPPPWDPTCDCAKRQIPLETYNGKPVYTATTIFKIDDTGVYFDPAKMHQADGVTYINQPFYVVNSIEEFLTRPPMTANNKATASIQVRQHTPDTKSVKLKSKNIVGSSDLNVYKSYSYTYPMEELPKPKTNYKKIELDNTEDVKKMDQSLSKCVDLYLMAESRIYNNGSELAKIWGKSKYHKFSKLSDEDLMVTMQQECNEKEDFVKKHVEEIIDKHSKKKIVENNENSSKAKQYKSFLEPNYVAKTGNVDIGSSSDSDMENFETSPLLARDIKNPFQLNPVDTLDAFTLSSDSLKETTPTQEAKTLDTKMAAPNAEPFKTLARSIDDTDRPSMNNDKGDEEKFPLNNLTVYNNMHETKLPQWIPVYDPKTSMEGDNDDKKNQAIEKYSNSTIASQYADDIATATVIYAKDRPKYNENEVPPPRVITREFAEGVVDSVINGTEDLQRDDFADEGNEDIVNPMDASVTEAPADTIQVEVDHKQIPLLIGNLYFRFGEDYVPAKFVQKPDGKVHVAIDGPTICTKINLESDNESSRLSDLCDKFQNN